MNVDQLHAFAIKMRDDGAHIFNDETLKLYVEEYASGIPHAKDIKRTPFDQKMMDAVLRKMKELGIAKDEDEMIKVMKERVTNVCRPSGYKGRFTVGSLILDIGPNQIRLLDYDTETQAFGVYP